jgi:Tol biopolymer transport system component
MSWSPDGEWLSYTVVSSAGQDTLEPGWLFDTSKEGPVPMVRPVPSGTQSRASGSVYRIWATHRSRKPSVLIEQSNWLLTSPAWSPRGKSIAFGRFVPESIEPAQRVERGRLEVVIQDGLDRKRVVWSLADFELDPLARDQFSQLSCCWSPDGLYLAITRPGSEPAIEIVRTDSGKRLHILDQATDPAWSPDGTKCAFIHRENGVRRLEFVERRGQSFSDARQLVVMGPVQAAPHWSSDGRAILAVVGRSSSRSPELEIVRLGVEPGETFRLMTLVASEPLRRTAAVRIRGVVLDFDRETERCFFSVDLDGRDSDVAWAIPRERAIHKRFHPLDGSQRIVGLAVSPDGQMVAMRLVSPTGATPPVVYNCETDQTTLFVPDHEARREWLSVLARTASTLLRAALPPAVADGHAAQRPTLLPLPGELPLQESAIVRLSRLGRFGAMLASDRGDRPAAGNPPGAGSGEIEARLFFDYLEGDYHAAAADLAELEPLVSSPQERLSILSLRAQILWARGDKAEAQAIIDYLQTCVEPERRLVEETPLGLVFAPYVTPQQAWARYMSARAAETKQLHIPPPPEPQPEGVDSRIPDLLDIRNVPFLERGPGQVPFVPEVPPRGIR